MKAGHDAFQTVRPVIFNFEMQLAVVVLHAEIVQERHQPVAGEGIVVLRKNLLHSGGIIVPGGQVRAEQQNILWANQRCELGQDDLRLEIRNHAEKSRDA